jgi:integrase
VTAKWRAIHQDNPSEQLYWHPDLYEDLWTSSPLPEEQAGSRPRASIPLEYLFRHSMRQYCFKTADFGLAEYGLKVDDWSRTRLAKAIGAALQRASLDLERQSQGDFSPEESARLSELFASITGSAASPDSVRPDRSQSIAQSSTITSLLEARWQEAKAAGRKPSTHESYRNTVQGFVRFLGHNEARRVTTGDVVAFKDHRLKTPSVRTGKVPSAKTVKDSDLSALKAVFGWAVANRKLEHNPAQGVTIKLGRARKSRSKGFDEAEARAILSAALKYTPGRDSTRTAVAKRWVPWLCAFTGARVGEIAQLRREDVRCVDNRWIIHITPDAGTQKMNESRQVVLHRQLLELGFVDFVQSCPEGPLFLKPNSAGEVLGPLRALKNRLAEFGRLIVSDPDVAPTHGWRHRFKTVGMEAGIDTRILDAIQGQAPRSVAESYGHVTLRTMAEAINKLRLDELRLSYSPAEAAVGKEHTCSDVVSAL